MQNKKGIVQIIFCGVPFSYIAAGYLYFEYGDRLGYSRPKAVDGLVHLLLTLIMIKMTKQSKLPPGWDENRMKRALDHYKSQSEDEAGYEDIDQTFIR